MAGMLSVSVSEMSPDEDHMPPEMQSKFMILSRSPLAWIAQAAAGYPLPLVTIFASAIVLALITLRLTERAFIEGTQNIAENETAARPGTADAPFRPGVLFLEVSKCLRLIVRTPMMTVQCLAQALMPIGIACVLGRDDVGRAVAFFVIFAAGVLSGMFTIAAGTVEECEDLLAMSPRPLRLFRYGKMVSGCVYPLGVAFLVGLSLLAMGEGDLCHGRAARRHSARARLQPLRRDLRRRGQARHQAQAAGRPDHDDPPPRHADHQRRRRRRLRLRRLLFPPTCSL